MKKTAALFLVLLSGISFAQGYHRVENALTRGPGVAANVLPYAKVTVCLANSDCATTIPVYSDEALEKPLPNPITADASGNYSYYVGSVCVDEKISGPGIPPFFVKNVCIPSPSGGGAVSSVSGAGTGISVSPSTGAIVVQNTKPYNSPGNSLPFTGTDSSGNPTAAPYTPVDRNGGTMSSDPTVPLGVATKQYVDTAVPVASSYLRTAAGSGVSQSVTQANATHQVWNFSNPDGVIGTNRSKLTYCNMSTVTGYVPTTGQTSMSVGCDSWYANVHYVGANLGSTNYGPTGWTVGSLLSLGGEGSNGRGAYTVNSSGIGTALGVHSQKLGAGDFHVGEYTLDKHNCFYARGADEGCTTLRLDNTAQNQEYTATVIGGTTGATVLTLNCLTVCGNPDPTQFAPAGLGQEQYLIDSANMVASGNVSGATTSIGVTTGTIDWTATAPNATGSFTANVNTPYSGLPVNMNTTVSMTSGTLVDGQPVCVWGNGTLIERGLVVSGGATTSPVIKLRFAWPAGAQFSQGGLSCRFLETTPDTQTVTGNTLRYLFRILTNTASTVSFTRPSGGFLAGYSYSASFAVKVWDGATILDPNNPSSGNVDGSGIAALEPNTALWTGAVEQTEGVSQVATLFHNNRWCYNPFGCGPQYSDGFNGVGTIRAPYWAINNQNPLSLYSSMGGRWNPEAFFWLSGQGLYGPAIYTDYAPTSSDMGAGIVAPTLLSVGPIAPGSTDTYYYVWQARSSGNGLKYTPGTATLAFTGSVFSTHAFASDLSATVACPDHTDPCVTFSYNNTPRWQFRGLTNASAQVEIGQTSAGAAGMGAVYWAHGKGTGADNEARGVFATSLESNTTNNQWVNAGLKHSTANHYTIDAMDDTGSTVVRNLLDINISNGKNTFASYATAVQTVTYSTTPSFDAAIGVSEITLTGDVTSWTLAAPGTTSTATHKCIIWTQDEAGGHTVSGTPTNVSGFFTVGTMASLSSQQCYNWSPTRSTWLADSPGVINE